jgi:dipeptidyl aminopeptidase/acylaminoacyl peptidase
MANVPIGTRKVELFFLSAQDDTLWQAADDAVNVSANLTTKVVLRPQRVGDARPDTVAIEASPLIDRIGRPFAFQVLARDAHDPDDSLNVRWDFDGDGTYDTDWSTEKQAVHAYGGVGNYLVVVQVRDRTGNLNTNTNALAAIPLRVRAIDLIAQAGAKGLDRDTAVVAIPGSDRVALEGRTSSGLPASLGDSLIYHWKHLLNFPGALQVSVENTFNANKSRDAGEIRFAPSEGAGLYAFALTVEYAGVFSDPDTLLMQVRSRPPSAAVEAPDTVRLGEEVRLVGRASDPDDPTGASLSYRWRGAQVGLLSDSTSKEPTFVPAREGSYAFELVVWDADPQESPPARVEIRVQSANQVPVADAGADAQGVTEVEISLDGSGSSDADQGDQLNYAWTSLDGPVLSTASGPRPSFRADLPGVYRFVLVVNDGELDSQPDTVAVNVAQKNRPPLADAGADAVGQVGELVRLNGGSSSDPDGDLPLQYQWTALDGGLLNRETQAQAEFRAEAPGEYRIALVVGDGELESAPDTVRVQVRDLPRLVFAARESDTEDLELYSARLDGSDRIRLTASAGDDLRPATSPDGQVIVFASARLGSADEWTQAPAFDIWQIDADGTNPVKLVDTADWPALSADLRLAFSRNSGLLRPDDEFRDPVVDLFVREPDGLESAALTDGNGKNTEPSWSPAGRLAFARWDSLFGRDLYLAEADGSGLTQLTNTPEWDEEEPAWSPDGTRIAFVANQEGNRGIYLVGPEGGEAARLTGEAGAEHLSPAWSPDGSLIAYVRLDFDGRTDIYLMDADGSEPRLVIENAQDPAWLPGK